MRETAPSLIPQLEAAMYSTFEKNKCVAITTQHSIDIFLVIEGIFIYLYRQLLCYDVHRYFRSDQPKR